MKTIAITGHTGGLGSALTHDLNDAFTVKGFSSSTGVDLTTLEGKQLVIDELNDCDVLINNAFVPDGHTTNLLQKAIEVWRGNKEKMIVHIGSDIVNYHSDVIPPDMLTYQQEKLAQHKLVRAAQWDPESVPIVNILLGAMDTPAASAYEGAKLDTQYVAMLITETILYWPKLHVRELLVMPPEL